MQFSLLTPEHSVWTKLIVCLFLACIVVGSLDALAAERQYLWQSRDQFVALVVEADRERVAMELKVGDRVIYGKYSGTQVELDGEEIILIKEADVIAKLS